MNYKKILLLICFVLSTGSMNASWRVALEAIKASSKGVNQAAKDMVVKAKNSEFVVKATNSALNQYAKAKDLFFAQKTRLQDKFGVLAQESKSINTPTTYFGTSKTEANITNNFYAQTGFFDWLKTTGDKGKFIAGGAAGFGLHAAMTTQSDGKPQIIIVERDAKTISAQIPALDKN